MIKYIELKEDFVLFFEEDKQKINIKGLNLYGNRIADDWMEVADFVAILEAATRNKLGTKKKYYMSPSVSIYGKMYDNDYHVCIDIKDDYIYKFDIVQVIQLVSKLNKLLHMANKLLNVSIGI